DGQGDLRPDSRDAQQEQEERALPLGEEAVEGKSVFPDVGVDPERGGALDVGQLVKGGQRDVGEIAEAGDGEEDLIGWLGGEASRQAADHCPRILGRKTEDGRRKPIDVGPVYRLPSTGSGHPGCLPRGRRRIRLRRRGGWCRPGSPASASSRESRGGATSAMA